MAHSTQVPIAGLAIHDILVRQDLLPTSVTCALLCCNRVQHVAHLALCDRLASLAQVPVALPAIHDHLASVDLLLTLVALAMHGCSRLQRVALGTLWQGPGTRHWNRRLSSAALLRVAVRAQVPIATAAIHHHVALLRPLVAKVALTRPLRHPTLQGVAHRTLRDGLALHAKIPIALAAVHHHGPLLHTLSAPIARAGDRSRGV
mmetsp:Transcript_133404/g.285269  ORF Transcript_133404/g.285269 Transcript_133404/m.285269 type:complete len:204 (+) Transcript_133404:193-804(+)